MAEKFSDKLKGFFMGPDDDDYDYEDEYEDDYEEVVPIQRSVQPMNKVAPMQQQPQQGAGQVRVVIYEPVSYDEDAPAIVESLKNRKVCIVNLEKIEDLEVSRTIFNFLNGAIYAMNGNIKKISKGIFILAPSNIDIDGNIRKELESSGFFNWQS